MPTRARADLNLATVTFPATRAATGTKTIVGEAQYPFEIPGGSGDGSWGGANVYFHGDTVFGDSIVAKTYISFGAGDSWVQVDEDGKGHNGTFTSGGGPHYRRFFIPVAPRIRVSFTFDDAAVLATGHNLGVDIECLEYEPEVRRTVFQDVLDIGDSVDIETFSFTVSGDTMEVNNPSKILIWCNQINASLHGDSGDTGYINIQGSHDEANWWTMQAITTAVPRNGDSIYRNTWQIVERPDFPKYLRLQYAGDSAVFWSSMGAEVRYYVVAYE